MRHIHDFDATSPAFHAEDLTPSRENTDPARGPRGLALAIALGLVAWGAVLLVVVALT